MSSEQGGLESLGGEWYIVLAVVSNASICSLQIIGREIKERGPDKERKKLL